MGNQLVQVSGGAFISATIIIEGPQEFRNEVLTLVRATLAEFENGVSMPVDFKN